MIKNLVWTAPIYDRSGYAQAVRGYILQLLNKGFCIRTEPDIKNPKINAGCSEEDLKWLLSLTETEVGARFKKRGEYFRIFQKIAPGFIYDSAAHANIGYSVFECTKISQMWADKCNEMDEVWTASRFCKETFEASGVTKPIHIIPHGADPYRFSVNSVPLKIPSLKNRFIFLSVLDWTSRKNYDGLVSAFIQEFKSDEPVCLLLKIYGGYPDIKRDILKIKARNKVTDAPQMLMITQNLPQELMPRLYATARENGAYITMTKGEAWNLPLSEAMSSGVATIAPNWGGITEFTSENTSYLIDIDGLELVNEMPWIPWYDTKETPDMMWSVPNISHARELMRHVYENPEERGEMALKARKHIMENYTWKHAVSKIMTRLEELSQSGAVMGEDES